MLPPGYVVLRSRLSDCGRIISRAAQSLSLEENLHNSSNDTDNASIEEIVADLFKDKTLLMNNLRDIPDHALSEYQSQFQFDS
jgi:hypothetical protein